MFFCSRQFQVIIQKQKFGLKLGFSVWQNDELWQSIYCHSSLLLSSALTCLPDSRAMYKSYCSIPCTHDSSKHETKNVGQKLEKIIRFTWNGTILIMVKFNQMQFSKALFTGHGYPICKTCNAFLWRFVWYFSLFSPQF